MVSEAVLEPTPAPAPAPAPGPTSTKPTNVAQAPAGVYAIALWEYVPQQADELAVQPNDALWVLAENPNGWWLAQRADGSGIQGLIPHNYVEKRVCSRWRAP